MKRTSHRQFLAAAAAALLLAGMSVQAQGLTRADVRAELAEWRAQGMLDQPGEAGATSDVLQARERFNATQTRILIARYELEQQERAGAEMPAQPEITRYTEAGIDGPVLVVIRTDADGTISEVDSITVAGLD